MEGRVSVEKLFIHFDSVAIKVNKCEETHVHVIAVCFVLQRMHVIGGQGSARSFLLPFHYHLICNVCVVTASFLFLYVGVSRVALDSS